jgi:uncharacterized protein (DUF433 family)
MSQAITATQPAPASGKYVYLAPNPKSAYKELFIKGTRIRASTLYELHVDAESPRTAEQIAADFHVPLDAVREAIAYCESNPPEIASDLAAEEALMQATGMNDPGYKYHPSPKLLSPQEMARLRQL